MKLLLIVLSLCISLVAQAEEELQKQITLANPGDFVLISDVDEPELTVFLSYTGRWINHCGIVLRTTSFVTDASALKEVITIETGHPSPVAGEEIRDGRLVAVVSNPDAASFGEFFKIRTKSGASLESVLKSLNNSEQVDVIVENLDCSAIPE